MQDSPYSAQLEISTGIAQVYKTRYGRGPRRITAHVHRESVVCVLSGVNTPAISALVGFGKIDAAQVVHAELQMGMAPEMSAVVERATGRTVVAYVPGFNARADATTDTFLLEPEVEADVPDVAATRRNEPASPQVEPMSTPRTAQSDPRVLAALERLGRALADTRAALHRLVEDVERHAGPPERSGG